MPCQLLFIVDHDMTLVDTLGVFYRTYRDACLLKAGRMVGIREFLEGFCSDSLREPPGVDALDFWSYFKDSYRARGRDDLRPMPGARRLLEELRRQGHAVVVVSGRGRPEVIERELAMVGLGDLVESVHTVGGRGFGKADIFRRLAEAAGLPCVAVGDYKMDLASAVEAGCLPVGVTAGCKDPESHRRAGASVVVGSPGGLVPLLGLVEERACSRG